MITFTVRGIPAPQGSKRFLGVTGRGRVRLAESSKRVAPWRSDIRDQAERAMRDHSTPNLDPLPPLTGPVAVELAFRLPRPKGHYRTGAHAGELRPAAPIWPATKPDLDKLVRAVLDACSALVWTDDAQVVDLGVRKRYADGEGPGVTVTVRDLSNPPPTPQED